IFGLLVQSLRARWRHHRLDQRPCHPRDPRFAVSAQYLEIETARQDYAAGEDRIAGDLAARRRCPIEGWLTNQRRTGAHGSVHRTRLPGERPPRLSRGELPPGHELLWPVRRQHSHSFGEGCGLVEQGPSLDLAILSVAMFPVAEEPRHHGGGKELAAGEPCADGAGVKQREANLALKQLRRSRAKCV